MGVRRFGSVECFEIAAKSVLNRVEGMPFKWSINPYRGCYHQCVFCYARRTHTYLEEDGRRAWGTRLYAKVNAPQVLRAELARPGWKREAVALGTATDPYQPIEGTYRITRGILEALSRARTPVSIITRSPLIVRDADVLVELAHRAPLSICFSLPTLDAAIARKLEPTVAPPSKRLFAMQTLAARGLRVGLAVAPIVPHLTDAPENFAALVRAGRDCGASFMWPTVLNLRETARDAFFDFLRRDFPGYVEEFERLYARPYVDATLRRTIATRFGSALRSLPLPQRDLIEPELIEEQLAFF